MKTADRKIIKAGLKYYYVDDDKVKTGILTLIHNNGYYQLDNKFWWDWELKYLFKSELSAQRSLLRHLNNRKRYQKSVIYAANQILTELENKIKKVNKCVKQLKQ